MRKRLAIASVYWGYAINPLGGVRQGVWGSAPPRRICTKKPRLAAGPSKIPLIKQLPVRVLAHNLKRALVNDSATTVADVEVIPACDRFLLISVLVTRKETVVDGCIAANANPRLFIARFVANFLLCFHDGELYDKRFADKNRPCVAASLAAAPSERTVRSHRLGERGGTNPTGRGWGDLDRTV